MVRTVASSSGSAAQGFTDHLNRVLKTTLTASRLSLVEIPDEEDLFLIKRVEGGDDPPLELPGTQRTLFAQQVIRVVDSSDGGKHCRTVSYRYRLQADDSPISTLIRWEYDRDPPRADYMYPPAHVHFHGELGGDDARGLHVPTGRVPLEYVAWHLIVEWEVTPLVDEWKANLEASIEGFRKRRTAH